MLEPLKENLRAKIEFSPSLINCPPYRHAPIGAGTRRWGYISDTNTLSFSNERALDSLDLEMAHVRWLQHK